MPSIISATNGEGLTILKAATCDRNVRLETTFCDILKTVFSPAEVIFFKWDYMATRFCERTETTFTVSDIL